jgi:hypothetical protein
MSKHLENEKRGELLMIIGRFCRSFHPEVYPALQEWSKRWGVEYPPTIASYQEAVLSAIGSTVGSVTGAASEETHP